MLVRRGNRPAADAGRWQRLPVPGLFAEGGGWRGQGRLTSFVQFAEKITGSIYASITLRRSKALLPLDPLTCRG
jgi:hypothetical protein